MDWTWKAIRRSATEGIFGNGIWYVLTAGGAAALAWLAGQQVDLAFYVLVFLLSAFALLGIRNEVRASRRMNQLSNHNNLERRVRQWLDNSGWAVQTIKNQSARFQIQAEKGGTRIVVADGRDNDGFFILAARLRLDDSHIAAFSKLTKPQQMDLIREIRIELTHLHINFAVDYPLRFIEYDSLVPNVLAEHDFIAAVNDMRRTTIAMRQLVQMHLGDLSELGGLEARSQEALQKSAQ